MYLHWNFSKVYDKKDRSFVLKWLVAKHFDIESLTNLSLRNSNRCTFRIFYIAVVMYSVMNYLGFKYKCRSWFWYNLFICYRSLKKLSTNLKCTYLVCISNCWITNDCILKFFLIVNLRIVESALFKENNCWSNISTYLSFNS